MRRRQKGAASRRKTCRAAAQDPAGGGFAGLLCRRYARCEYSLPAVFGNIGFAAAAAGKGKNGIFAGCRPSPGSTDRQCLPLLRRLAAKRRLLGAKKYCCFQQIMILHRTRTQRTAFAQQKGRIAARLCAAAVPCFVPKPEKTAPCEAARHWENPPVRRHDSAALGTLRKEGAQNGFFIKIEALIFPDGVATSTIPFLCLFSDVTLSVAFQSA